MGVEIEADIKSSCPEDNVSSTKKPEDIGEALEIVLKHAGGMGRYQRWLFIAMLPFGISMAFVYFVTIFTIATPEKYWCHVPELAHLDLELRRNLSAPGAADSWNRCSTFETNWTSVLETMEPPHPDTPTTETCKDGWVFELEDIPFETVVTQRNWVCQFDSFVPTVQMAFFAGAFFGGLIFGWLADRFGRVPAIVAVNLVGFIGATSCIFTNNFWDFMVCRFIAGMSYDNCFMLVYILVLEYVGAKHRTWVANLSIMLYYGGGCIVLPWLALWLANWKTLMVVTAAPMLCALAAPFLFPESARWLSSRGQHERAVRMLQRLERVNRRQIPKEAMDNFIVLSTLNKDSGESLRVLVSISQLRLLLILLVILYTCCSIVFDALARLSGSLGMNMFVAFTLSSATEVPSILLVIFLLDRLGRRMMASGSMFAVALLCVIASFVQKGIARASLAISARFFVNMAFNTIIQWVAEVLPSSARAAGCSVVHVTALLLSSVSPFIVYAEQIWSGLPFIIIGGLALFAAFLSVIIPETLNQTMPHNCADAKRLVDRHSLLGKFIYSRQVKDTNNAAS